MWWWRNVNGNVLYWKVTAALCKIGPYLRASCDKHEVENRKWIIKMLIKIFWKNKQKLIGGSARKEVVSGFNQRQGG